jgi:hypothetical protein
MLSSLQNAQRPRRAAVIVPLAFEQPTLRRAGHALKVSCLANPAAPIPREPLGMTPDTRRPLVIPRALRQCFLPVRRSGALVHLGQRRAVTVEPIIVLPFTPHASGSSAMAKPPSACTARFSSKRLRCTSRQPRLPRRQPPGARLLQLAENARTIIAESLSAAAPAAGYGEKARVLHGVAVPVAAFGVVLAMRVVRAHPR